MSADNQTQWYYGPTTTDTSNITTWWQMQNDAAQRLHRYAVPAPQQPQPEVRRTKELRIRPSLKGFEVEYQDAKGGVQKSEYKLEELKVELEGLLAKLKKEPKEE